MADLQGEGEFIKSADTQLTFANKISFVDLKQLCCKL